jgi:hypothetical protein
MWIRALSVWLAAAQTASARTCDGTAWMVERGPNSTATLLAMGDRPPGPSRWIGVCVPTTADPSAVAARLRAAGATRILVDTAVAGSGPKSTASALTTTTRRIASTSTSAAVAPSPLAWHPGAAGATGAPPSGLSGVVVAVLDTGVAYQSVVVSGQRYVAASGLATSQFVAPADFVDADRLPLDQHQHGTHIASLIASTGVVPGVAPGVTLMPVRVLDANNTGREIDLVDGLHWAIDHGADVINLSLSFPPGYTPSLPLREALARAHEAGVVVVGASGNTASGLVTWPAASPAVIAVGAIAPGPSGYRPASYADLDPKVALLAPGGDLRVDYTKDAWPDGVLAETIGRQDPSSTGLWWYEGTSQAAALTSGAAARLLALGVPAWHVDDALMSGARNELGGDVVDQGYGAGLLDVERAQQWARDGSVNAREHDYSVAVLPYLRDRGDGRVEPRARLTLLIDGVPAADGRVLGSFWGATQGGIDCTVTSAPAPGEGHCDVAAPAVSYTGEEALGWLVRVDTVAHNGLVHRPTTALFATDALEVLTAAMLDDPELSDAALGFWWDGGLDPDLGLVAESLVVTDLGSGLLSSPMGVILTPKTLSGTTLESRDLDLDGTGLLSSPMGFRDVRVLSLDGTGLLSSPMGFTSRIAFIDGTGLLSSPMGLRATSLTVYGASTGSFDATGSWYDGEAVPLGSGAGSSDDTALGAWLDGGGGVTASGLEGASLLLGEAAFDPYGVVGTDATTAPIPANAGN